MLVFFLSYVDNIYLLNSNANLSRIYYGLDTRISNFLIGVIAAIVIKKFESDIKNISMLKIKVLEVILVTMIVLSMFFNIHDSFDIVFYINFYSIMVAFFIMILYYHFEMDSNHTDGFLNLISNKKVIFLSNRSYVIYLIHYPVIVFFDKFTAHVNITTFIYVISILLIVAIVSEFTYKINASLLKYKNKKVVIGFLAFLSLLSIFISNLMNLGIINIDEKVRLQNEELKKAINEDYESENFTTDSGIVETFNEIGNSDSVSDYENRRGNNYNDGIIEEESYNISTLSIATESIALIEEKKLIDAALKRIKKVNIRIGGIATLFEDEYVNNRNVKVTIIGDSITGCAASLLKLYFPNIVIDQVGNRQLKDAPYVYEKLKSEGKLGDFVIIALGTNSTYDIDTDSLEKVYNSLDGRIMILPTIVLPYRVETTRNKALRGFADEHEYCYIAEWNAGVKTHTECFMSDSIHPTGIGNDAFAQIMFKTIVNIINKQEN